MSNYTNGTQTTVVEGGILDLKRNITTNYLHALDASIPLQKAYDTLTYYGRPQRIEDAPEVGPPTVGLNPHDLGDGQHMDIHKALHSLLSGKLETVETRKLLTDRQRRG